MNKELINFVQWLPDNSEIFSGLTFEESINLINEMITSEEGKQSLEQLTKQYKSMELFKKGGKLDYLLCLKHGGPMDCGCGKKIEKAQGGSGTALDQEKYPEKTVERRDRYGFFSRKYNDKGHRVEKMTSKTPEGVVMETTRTISPMDTNYVVGPANKPLDFQTYVTPYAYSQMGPLMKLLNKPAPAEWGPLFDSYQKGGKVSRKEAVNSADSKKEGRQQYRQNKKNAKDAGQKGSEMRQTARKTTIKQNSSEPRKSVALSGPAASFKATPQQMDSPIAMSSAFEDNYERMARQHAQIMMKREEAAAAANMATNFRDAFSIARNAGLMTFKWNGKEFNTNLKPVIDEPAPSSSYYAMLDVLSGIGVDPMYGYSKPSLPEFINVEEESFYEEPGPWQAH